MPDDRQEHTPETSETRPQRVRESGPVQTRPYHPAVTASVLLLVPAVLTLSVVGILFITGHSYGGEMSSAITNSGHAALPASEIPPPAGAGTIGTGTTGTQTAGQTSTTTTQAAAQPLPAGTVFSPAQYADQVRGVIDQVAGGGLGSDATYSMGTVPQDTDALADGTGVDLVKSNCSVCHSTTLITSQPPLPGSTWHDEVYKMKQKYGAVFISDENANRIIDYLSAHYTPETRGKAATGSAVPATPATTTAATTTSAAPADGAQVYAANCSSCHGAQGAGVPGAFPPLAGNPAVVGDDKYISDVLLNGLQGQIMVKGQSYSGVMPAWAAQLSDAQIAAVASHVRSSWGNSGSAVTEETVKAERAAPKTAAQILGERPQ